MKKTLLTVALVLASSAFAADNSVLEQAIKLTNLAGCQTNTGAYSTLDGTNRQFTLTAVFDWQDLQNSVTKNYASALQIKYATEYGKRGFGFQIVDDTIVASAGYGDSTTSAVSTTTSLADYVGDSGQLVLTLSCSGSSGTFYIFNEKLNTLDPIGTSVSLAGGNFDYSRVYINSLGGSTLDEGYVWTKALDSPDVLTLSREILGISAPAVPEPATATLSLLALAGLCARRRRK